jgi:hypothetical protein
VSVRKEIVERYFEGFRQHDHELILQLLTDDVTWYVVPLDQNPLVAPEP